MRLIFTVDVELDLGKGPSSYGIERGLPFILSVLRDFDVKGTFFVNGNSLNKLLELKIFEKIVSEGHEIASHGKEHIDYRDLPEGEVKRDLHDIKTKLERLSGSKVIGFRAPQFRVNLPLIETLKEVGYIYDSSIPEPKCLSAASLLRNVKTSTDILKKITDVLYEFPVTCIPIIRIPHGLLWISKLRFNLYKFFFQMELEKDKNIVFYVHPFDLVVKDSISKPILNGVLRKSFYFLNLEDPKQLLVKILEYWKEKGVKFSTFKELFAGG